MAQISKPRNREQESHLKIPQLRIHEVFLFLLFISSHTVQTAKHSNAIILSGLLMMLLFIRLP